MGTVQARKPKELIPAVVTADAKVIERVIELQADAKTKELESTTTFLNRDVQDGLVPGVPNPLVANDGTIIDPLRQRTYTLGEVAIICALPEVVDGVKAVHEEAARWEDEKRRAARVDQLALARTIKQARAERERCPLLYRQVEELTAAVEWLLDRSFDEAPEFSRVLPELKDDGELTY